MWYLKYTLDEINVNFCEVELSKLKTITLCAVNTCIVIGLFRYKIIYFSIIL